MKNLFLKITLSLFLFIAIFLFLNFFYNQNKDTLAAEGEEEEIDYEKLKCGREIPVGEAMEKTGELLKEIVRGLEIIETNSYYLIKAQKEMEGLAKKCSMDNCTPKCEAVTIKDITIACVSKSCQGDVCPGREKIEELFAEITRLNEEIQAAKDKLYKLIYESVEPLCIKENEDIRTILEKAQCIVNPNLSITIQEAIRRKLDLSREEFDKCYISPANWEKVARGEKIVKILWNCDTVMDRGLPRYTKTMEKVNDKEIPVCTSFHNWFCCH